MLYEKAGAVCHSLYSVGEVRMRARATDTVAFCVIYSAWASYVHAGVATPTDHCIASAASFEGDVLYTRTVAQRALGHSKRTHGNNYTP